MSMQLKISDQRHKQKLNLKALDAVLFGPPLRESARCFSTWTFFLFSFFSPQHLTAPLLTSSRRSATQLDEGFCPDDLHSDRRRRLLVCVRAEQVEQGAHLPDDEGSGELAARRAEPPGPAEPVRAGKTEMFM